MVDIALEGFAAAPMERLLDIGALRTRMSAELAPLAGIELTGSSVTSANLTSLMGLGGIRRLSTRQQVAGYGR